MRRKLSTKSVIPLIKNQDIENPPISIFVNFGLLDINLTIELLLSRLSESNSRSSPDFNASSLPYESQSTAGKNKNVAIIAMVLFFIWRIVKLSATVYQKCQERF